MTTEIDVVAERSALGGLEQWIFDPSINEILVNGDGAVWIERAGRLTLVAALSEQARLSAIEHMLAPLGRRIDRSSPTVDARLPDGSRLCAAISPVSVDGPALCVRRFATATIPVQSFAPAPVCELLQAIVRRHCNVLLTGATSSGKTTLLNTLVGLSSIGERIVTMEDIAELRIAHPHVQRLECRPASADGVGEVTLAHLLRTALRMRPDRLVVGEIRGHEVLPLMQALNTGHRGSFATLHANSASDALARVASLVVQEAPGWPMAAVHDAIRRAVDIVVHLERGPAGHRSIASIDEVLPSGDQLALQRLADCDSVLRRITRGSAG